MSYLRRAERVDGRFLNAVATETGGIGIALKVMGRMLTNREERMPKRPLGPFRTDATRYSVAPESGLRVTWFGHSSTLIEIDGMRVLIDPVWGQRVSPVQWFGPKRFFAPTMRLEELPRIDAVLISHDHYDHLDEYTIRQLARLSPAMRWITSLGVGVILSSFGVDHGRITELDWTESCRVEGPEGASCEITSVPSRHFSGRSLSNRFETLWASFVLRGAEHKVYYGADSGLWDGFAEIGSAYGPFDLVMLEIGAYDEMWRSIHMGPGGAAKAFRELLGSGGDEQSTLLMPVHWGLFDLALHAWRQPIEEILRLAEADGLPLWQPAPGEPTEVQRGVGLRSPWWREGAGS